MSDEPAPPPWLLPEGVDGPLWQYARSHRLAEQEDDYFVDHPLLKADVRFLTDRLVEPGPLIDLGCGAGRLSAEFARRGFPVVAVDLSRPMLRAARSKAVASGRTILPVQANLCRLETFRPGSFRYALAMFSTIGMIRGGRSRRRALEGIAAVLRPGGLLALHAHNLWLNLGDPQGRAWLLGQLGRVVRGEAGVGDRLMTYRGVPGMRVHLYRWGELRADLGAAGLTVEEVVPIDAVTARPIAAPWLAPGMRAGGWFVMAGRPGG